MSTFLPQGLGWIPDLPDPRDLTIDDALIRQILSRLPALDEPLPDRVDLRHSECGEHYLSDSRDQGEFHSASAIAVLGLTEYFSRRVTGKAFHGSARFLYKVARNLRRIQGDFGVDLRSTLKTMVKFGAVNEADWPYHSRPMDQEPTAFVYQLAEPLRGVRYCRLPTHGRRRDGLSVWQMLCRFLAAGFPFVFGFSVGSSITHEPVISLRPQDDSILGGMSAIALGYDLHRLGRNQAALLIGTSWGNQWGHNGTGWLPMSFVDHSIARDFWTLIYTAGFDPLEFANPIR
ncbi:C1 family peptidase [Stieleria sp. TO1_6]|uniref:C1 family peptidase n=1 Tax=Stieleria tagensis TaxID=2956795 RepID=UPI00209AEC1D|nr:C1 family peptidase [Stieleria tagensis]MCO8123926.1 C1 family peptidase [Stieleria tagensis]